MEVIDNFLTRTTCTHCGGSLNDGRICSMFSTDCICIPCSDKERQDPDYKKAVEADHEQIKRGNYNFPGIRSGKVK